LLRKLAKTTHIYVFLQMPHTIQQSLNDAKLKLKDAGIDTYSLDAEVLLAHVLGLSRLDMLIKKNEEITATQQAEFNTLISRRAQNEPIAYIVGHKEFWGLEFKVTNDTLIPRPDTETLIECVLKEFRDKNANLKILDLGTGTGCIALTLLHEYRNASATLVDISDGALEVAKHNAKHIGVSNRAGFIKSDWFRVLPESTFDIIASNPPYIARDEELMKDVLDYEPHSALFADNKGLDAYRKILSSCKHYMHEHTITFFEIGSTQANDITALASEYGFTIQKIAKDLSGMDRVAVLQIKP
jgi:release factor glutamine methyltransferase